MVLYRETCCLEREREREREREIDYWTKTCLSLLLKREGGHILADAYILLKTGFVHWFDYDILSGEVSL